MDSKPLVLTANTSTIYVTPILDTKKLGPMVIEIPSGMLGAINDSWFNYVADFGPFGEDKGLGGKYVILPPNYEEELPKGYFIVRPKTYRTWIFLRGSISNGLNMGVKNIEENLKIYPLNESKPKKMEFVDMSNTDINTVFGSDFSLYNNVNDIIQYEPYESLDPVTRGVFATIGIEKGKPFNPDLKEKKNLVDAAEIGNGIARSIAWRPRIKGNMNGLKLYPDKENNNWMKVAIDKNIFFNGRMVIQTT